MQAGAWLRAAAATLHEAEVPRAMSEARALLAHATDETTAQLFAYPDRTLSAEERALADAFLSRRAQGEPPARILGIREFWSLPFQLGPDTLEPRPDTEIIVEAALEHAPSAIPSILDLGTGSGCILLALLHELQGARGIGVDQSLSATRVAQQNATALGMADRAAFTVSDWGAALKPGAADLIVSNPPYVATVNGPAPDTATADHDPDQALYAGPDGLEAYKTLLPDLPRLLHSGGVAVLEIGLGQAQAIIELAAEARLECISARPDLAGITRALIFRATSQK